MAYLRYSSAMALSALLMVSTLLASTGPQSAFGQTGSLKVTVVHTDASLADPGEFFPIVGSASGLYSLYDQSGVPVAEFSTLFSCNGNPDGCTYSGLQPGNYEARIFLPWVPGTYFSKTFAIAADALTDAQLVADYGYGQVSVVHQDGSLADYRDFYGNSFSQGFADIYDVSDQFLSGLATCNHPNSVGNNLLTTFCPAPMPSGIYVAEVAIRGIDPVGFQIAIETFSQDFVVTDKALSDVEIMADYGYARVRVVHADGSLAESAEFYAPVPNPSFPSGGGSGAYSLHDSSGFRSAMNACRTELPVDCEEPVPSGAWEARIVRALDSEELACSLQVSDLATTTVMIAIDNGNCQASDPKSESVITLAADAITIELSDSLILSGSVSPPHSAIIHLTLTRPDLTIIQDEVVSSADGSFSFSSIPDTSGFWKAEASWDGDAGHLGASSDELTLAITTKWALIFGISHYDDKPYCREPFVHDDTDNYCGAAQSGRMFTDLILNEYDYPPDHVHDRIDDFNTDVDDENGSELNFLSEMQWLQDNVQPTDFVVIYVASHGQRFGDEEAISMHIGLIRDRVMKENLNLIQSAKTVVILDVSFAGGFVRDDLNGDLLVLDNEWSDLALDENNNLASNRLILTGCGEVVTIFSDCKYYPIKPEKNGLLFSHYFFKGLKAKKADSNHDGTISVEEAFSYATDGRLVKRLFLSPIIYDSAPTSATTL